MGVQLANNHTRFEDSDVSDFSDSIDEIPDDLLLVKHSKSETKKKTGKI